MFGADVLRPYSWSGHVNAARRDDVHVQHKTTDCKGLKSRFVNIPVALLLHVCQTWRWLFSHQRREKTFQASSASGDEDEDDDGLGIWTHVSLSVSLPI